MSQVSDHLSCPTISAVSSVRPSQLSDYLSCLSCPTHLSCLSCPTISAVRKSQLFQLSECLSCPTISAVRPIQLSDHLSSLSCPIVSAVRSSQLSDLLSCPTFSAVRSSQVSNLLSCPIVSAVRPSQLSDFLSCPTSLLKQWYRCRSGLTYVVCWLLNVPATCLRSVSQGRSCSDKCTCCHTETESADQTFCFTHSQYIVTGPTSPSLDLITPGA